jgi:hypothetical protein
MKLNFYTIIEPFYSFRRDKNYIEDINKLYSETYEFFKNHDTVFFFHASLKKYFKKKHFFLDKDIYFLLGDKYNLNKHSLAYDITKGISFTGGAVFTMIALSAYMGFKEIYLLGCGYTYSPIQLYHFYNRPKISKKHTKSEINNRIEKFIQENDGLKLFGIEEDDEFIYPLFVTDSPVNHFHFELKKYFEGKGIKIYNVVPEGFESPIYEKISWEEVLLKINKGSL